MRLSLIVIALLVLTAALYAGTFHALVAWRGTTRTTIRGTPAAPQRETRREVLPSDIPLKASELLLVDCFKPLAALEQQWSKTPLAATDPDLIALHDALLMHAQVGDAQAAEGMTLSALHALPIGPERNPAPTTILMRKDAARGTWIVLSGPANYETAAYLHDRTRLHRVYE